MGKMVIACYKPKPGRADEVNALVRKHLGVLASQDLVTERSATILRASDGTILEIFEWRSVDAIAAAHSNRVVQALWAEFARACEYVPLSALPEAQQLFAEFDPVDP